MAEINQSQLEQYQKTLKEHHYLYPEVLLHAVDFVLSHIRDGIVVMNGLGFGIFPMALSVADRIKGMEIYTLVHPAMLEQERAYYEIFFKQNKPVKFTQISTEESPAEGRKWKSTVRRKVSVLVIADLLYMNDVMDFFMVWRSNLRSNGYLILFNKKSDIFPGVNEAVDYFIKNTMSHVFSDNDMVILKNTRSKI